MPIDVNIYRASFLQIDVYDLLFKLIYFILLRYIIN